MYNEDNLQRSINHYNKENLPIIQLGMEMKKNNNYYLSAVWRF
jgi:uncharacterized metal-binding protein